MLGGTPLNGYQEFGHFFLGSDGHFREVSGLVYRIVLVFNVTCLLFWPSLLSVGMFVKQGSIFDSRRDRRRR